MTMRTRIPIIALLLTLTCSCALMTPSAPYDPAFDAGLVALRKDVHAFFDELAASAGKPDGAYSVFAPEYRTFSDGIAALRGQAVRHARNDATVQSLDLLRENFDKVEAMHRDGLLPEEVEILRPLVDTQLRLLVELERAKRGGSPTREVR